MKTIVVSTIPTDPLDAGNRARVATLIQNLQSAGHEVHLAHIHTGHYDGDAMRKRVGADRLHLLPFLPLPPRLSFLPRISRIARRLLKRESAYVWSLDSWYDDRFTDRLRELDDAHHFEAVIVAYVFMSKAFDAFPKACLRVLDTHDRFGLRHRAFLRVGMRPRYFSTTLEEEERGFRRADVVLAIQEVEAEDFRKRLRGESPRVLNVGHLIAAVDPPPPSQRIAAVFLGSSNPINVQGVNYFIEHVLPLVRAAQPSFELLIAGSVADEIAELPGVVKLGYVPRLEDAFGAAMVFVNPVLMGTGITIKLLDALACGMPCVSTEAGARGLERYREALVTVPDHDPQSFARSVLALLSEGEARSTLRREALQAAERWNKDQISALQNVLRDTAPHA